jgi:hypothetical protein
MSTDDDRGDIAPDAMREDQPDRDDLLDPADIDPEWEDERPGDEDAGILPPLDELPESQGEDVLEAERAAEDASSRRLLSDEEADLDEPPEPR